MACQINVSSWLDVHTKFCRGGALRATKIYDEKSDLTVALVLCTLGSRHFKPFAFNSNVQ